MEKFIQATMLHLSTVGEVKDRELLELGRMDLEVDTPFASAEALRDHLIFFFPDGCMAQRSRCPGGRPSVSAN